MEMEEKGGSHLRGYRRLRDKYNLAIKPIMGEESWAMDRTMGFCY